MGPMIKFLQAVRRLAELGVKKEDIIEFGKREFGEMTELLSKQIDDIYKRFYKDRGGSIFKDKKPKTEKKGEVVPIKKKVDLSKYDDEALNRLVDEDIMLRGEADTLSDFGKDYERVKEIEKRRKEIREILEAAQKNPELVGGAKAGDVVELKKQRPIAKDEFEKMLDETFPEMKPKKEGIVSIVDETKEISKGLGEIKNETNLLPDSERLARGFPSRSVEAIVRTGARELLIRKGIEVGRQDPIDMARQIYGDEILDALDNISGELLDASSYPEISRILTEKKIYNFKPRQGLDIKQKGEIEDITAFDPEGRDPNAHGGLINILKL